MTTTKHSTTKPCVFHKVHYNANISRPRQNGRHFADDIFKCISLNENIWISFNNSLKCQINNIPALVPIVAWHRPSDKPLSEPMMVSSPTHICVIRPRWVKSLFHIAGSPCGFSISSVRQSCLGSVFDLLQHTLDISRSSFSRKF